MFLVNLSGGDCSFRERDSESDRPTCPLIDLMVANKYGFETSSHPNGDRSESECMRSFKDNEYGSGSAYTIDTDR